MSFNPDPNKTATEVIFSHKSIRPQHSTIYFNDFPIHGFCLKVLFGKLQKVNKKISTNSLRKNV